MRWMMDALQHARYKQLSCGIPLLWFLEESSRMALKEETQLTSAHLDFLPSPTPSPETSRKLNSGKQFPRQASLATSLRFVTYSPGGSLALCSFG